MRIDSTNKYYVPLQANCDQCNPAEKSGKLNSM